MRKKLSLGPTLKIRTAMETGFVTEAEALPMSVAVVRTWTTTVRSKAGSQTHSISVTRIRLHPAATRMVTA